LHDLRARGALTDEEFAAAKAAVIARGTDEGGPTVEPALYARLAELEWQAEVARLDREWDLERERYLVSGRHGHRSVPSRGMSVLGGVVMVGFGAVWTALAASMRGPGLFPLFLAGVVMILAGVGIGISTYSKAVAYERAQDDYRRRRSLLLEGRTEKPSWDE
jgi:hypothetical protein